MQSRLHDIVGLSLDATWNEVRSHIAHHFASLPSRYSLDVEPEDVIHHMSLLNKVAENNAFVVSCKLPLKERMENVVLITIVCLDKAKLFNSITGALDDVSVNVMDADVMTTKTGVAFDRFLAEVHPEYGNDLQRLESRIEETLSSLARYSAQNHDRSRSSSNNTDQGDNTSAERSALVSSHDISHLAAASPPPMSGSSLTSETVDLSRDSASAPLIPSPNGMLKSDDPLGWSEHSVCALTPSDISVTREVGRGLVTVTYEGTLLSTGERVAIKKPLSLENGDSVSEEAINLWHKEIRLMLDIGEHPNICRFIGSYVDTTDMFLCYEFLQGGCLANIILNPEKTYNPIQIAIEIAEGMKHLHSLNIMHRDLKSANVMLDSEGRAKIADFGLSCVISAGQEPTAETGTYRWMAPEVIRHESYSLAADVYSFGILFWELLSRSQPFAGLSPIQAAFGVAKNNLRPPIPRDINPRLKAILTRCWHPDPTSRPSFHNLCLLLPKI
eukprot:CAMPEP_0185031708 /NCGR_PEP_ID=MMETSP1103-20130426/19325_1 /TAXON_ID=36769 /ORGANISM="Paraphysomonas bandaiensis, Strain Caron Lab Isolate" /LENGTH=500 /DNA_ID=CAMNT_0027567323 /DNA_START=395 /DNA_END=1897 /DNA_ORIENTATION=-